MKSFFDWFEHRYPNKDNAWLILGKGPSFSKLSEYNSEKYHKLSLNHAVREIKVEIAHIIDLDVLEHLGDVLLKNAEMLVMPWHPHVHNKPSRSNLEQLVANNKILQQLADEGRLLWYNLSTSKTHNSIAPVVNVKYFSAEAAINLLAMAGIRHIRSLGIDGGSSYSNNFRDLKEKTLLSNGRTSFNEQFKEIAKTIFKMNIDYAPLDLESPIRVFVATTKAQMLSTKVLEYSIKRHTSMTCVVTPIHSSKTIIPQPVNPNKRPRTPFSFQRFLIPDLMNWKGRAIYLDSDMQVFDDLKEVWTMPFNGAEVLAVSESNKTGRKPQFSVMLLDCNKLDWRINEIVQQLDQDKLDYKELMVDMKIAKTVRADINSRWNSLERYEPQVTGLIHYTDMDTQPWVSTKNPLGAVWVEELFRAIDDNFISIEYIETHIKNSWIRPSLLWQINNRIAETLNLPDHVLKLDGDFVAPYQRLPKHGVSQWRKDIKKTTKKQGILFNFFERFQSLLKK